MVAGAAPGISVPIAEGWIASEQRERNTYQASDVLSHVASLLFLLRTRWIGSIRGPRTRARLCVRVGERHVFCAGSSGRREGIRRDRRFNLPVGEYEVVAKVVWIIKINRMEP